jgi:hypothetical protein
MYHSHHKTITNLIKRRNLAPAIKKFVFKPKRHNAQQSVENNLASDLHPKLQKQIIVASTNSVRMSH